MIAARPIAAFATDAAAAVQRFFERAVRIMLEARMRRIQREIEFHRSFTAYREANGSPLFIQQDPRERL